MNPHRTSLNAQRSASIVLLLLVPLIVFAGSNALRAATDFTAGVLSLVSLTAAVVWGLIATDRLLLSSRMRLVAQGVHRTVAVASVFFLLLHITVKVALGHVALLGALVPFGLGFRGSAGLIGFGSLAAYLLITAAATGALRSAFTTPGRTPLGIAGRWRTLHMLAYPAWCTGLVHGLYAGRAPATYVVVLYSLSLVLVAGALSVRMLPPPVKRRIAARITELAGPGAGSSTGVPLPPEVPVTPPVPERPPYQQSPSYQQAPPYQPTPPYQQALRPETRSYQQSWARGRPPSWPRAYEPPSFAQRPPQPEQPPQQPFQDPLTAPRPLYEPQPRTGVAGGVRWPAPAPPPPAEAPVYDAPDSPAYPSGYATEPLPGPFHPPSPGEPWHTPAGDRT
ncbi:hypothetical protein AB0436_03675 [Streptomyces sp. NPDC051322]|uniref:hypothetical protein n=1 Tax=Streptomyces sp. NPDC051322 TaxID=3154645 RepID=UPI00344FEB23